MKKIIIDTDPGVDDALAIMLAIKSEMFDVKAITTVMGNSSIENTTRNAQYVLKLLKRQDIPIYSGAEKPTNRELTKGFVMGESGLGDCLVTEEPKLTGNAAEKILEIINENPYKISIIAIGPLTNIAKAIILDPESMKKVKEIIIMGGAINVPGNMNRVAEFNIFTDPEAADMVFKFPIKKVLVPLDLCNKVELDLGYFNKINSSLRGPILDMVKDYMDRLEINETGKKVALVYDAFAVYYMINSNSYKLQNYDLVIETKGELTRGMTVVDLRKTSSKSFNCSVAFYIDKRRFIQDFIGILSKETFLNNKNLNKTSNEETKDGN